MPEIVTRFYPLEGWAPVLIFSESEMSKALQISREELRKAIKEGKISYSVHPKSSGIGEYEFSARIMEYNLLLWECLKRGGHYFEFVSMYDEAARKSRYKCRDCPAMKYD
jgi:hypothetical protein